MLAAGTRERHLLQRHLSHFQAGRHTLHDSTHLGGVAAGVDALQRLLLAAQLARPPADEQSTSTSCISEG